MRYTSCDIESEQNGITIANHWLCQGNEYWSFMENYKASLNPILSSHEAELEISARSSAKYEQIDHYFDMVSSITWRASDSLDLGTSILKGVLIFLSRVAAV